MGLIEAKKEKDKSKMSRETREDITSLFIGACLVIGSVVIDYIIRG